MKKILLFFAILFLFYQSQGRNKHAPASKDTLNQYFLLCNIRLFDWSIGGELKYLRLNKFDKPAFSPVFAIGYENFTKDNMIENGNYNVSGIFTKVGLIVYEKESRLTTYIGANTILSYSNQNVKSTFHDAVWGDYTESANAPDLSFGLELNCGVLAKIYKRLSTNFNISFGSRIGNRTNPLRNQLHLDDADANGFPFFSPGLGRGNQIYINAMAGFAYSF